MSFMRLSNKKLKPDDGVSLEKFDTLNALSLIANEQDHSMPDELEQAIIQFIDICLDYRVDDSPMHFISQLMSSNDSKTENKLTLSSVTGLKTHVVNTLIRQQVILKMNELARAHELKGAA